MMSIKLVSLKSYVLMFLCSECSTKIFGEIFGQLEESYELKGEIPTDALKQIFPIKKLD